MARVARPIDFSSLTPAERTVFTGGALLFVDGFVPWWYRTAGPSGVVTYNAGLTDWSVVAVAAGAIAVVAILARAAIWPEPAPGKDGALYTLLGVTGFTTLVGQSLTGTGVWWGVYSGIGLSAILTLGGLRRRRERRAGWS